MKGAWKHVTQSFQQSFSKDVVSDEDGRRFCDAGLWLLLAAFIMLIVILLTGSIAEDQNVISALPKIYSHIKILIWVFIFSVVFSITPWILFHYNSLRYCLGTILNSLSFLTLSLIFCAFVRFTGGIGSSMYSTSFVSLFAISLYVPKDNVLKFILFFITLFLSLFLLSDIRRDLVILILSLFSYVFSFSVKILLDSLKPPSPEAK